MNKLIKISGLRFILFSYLFVLLIIPGYDAAIFLL